MRICARLDFKGEYVIKGLQFEGLRKIGAISSIANQYFQQGADELFLIESTSSWFSVDTKPEIIAGLIEKIFVPITIGGGINSLQTADKYFDSGADKVAINTAFFKCREIAGKISQKYGAQALVLQLNVKEINDQHYCFVENGRTNTGLTIDEVISSLNRDEVGEIFVTSIDKDGSLRQPDFNLIDKILSSTDLPIIYGGGISNEEQCREIYNKGIKNIALGAALHYGKLNILELKQSLVKNHISCRVDSNV